MIKFNPLGGNFVPASVGPTGPTGPMGPMGPAAVAGKIPNGYVELTSPQGTTSATLVDVPGMSATITLDQSVEVIVTASFEIATQAGAAPSTVGVAINIDGTDYDEYNRYLSGSNDTGIGAITHSSKVPLAAGVHTVKLRFKRASGAATPGLNKADLTVFALQSAKGDTGPAGPATLASVVPGLAELLEFDWATLYLPPLVDGQTHASDAGSIAQWVNFGSLGSAQNWVQNTHARQPRRGVKSSVASLEFIRANTHYMTRTPPNYSGVAKWTRVICVAYNDTTSEYLVSTNDGDGVTPLHVRLNANGANSATVSANSGGSAIVAGTVSSTALAIYTIVYDGTQSTNADRLDLYLNKSTTQQSETVYGTIAATLQPRTQEYLGSSSGLASLFDGHIVLFGEIAGALTGDDLAEVQRAVNNLLGVV